ncbi:MAG: aminoacyl-tRNA hydrolase [Actinobacteria bacterium]|nr:aminoacyl-tRNA hydrolase [Actinomycetota bacterium]
MAWLVAGLGNPGERYAGTRHNVGAMTAGVLCSRAGERFRKVRFVPVESAEIAVDGERVLLARSLQYMNVSGPGYASLARRRGVPAERVVAVHDEIDLPFGALKLKSGGSTAGHRGLDSLAGALGTRGFPRVRIGVGRPPGRQDAADHVLRRFNRSEQPEVDLLVEEAADAVLALIREGLQAAQDRFNRSGRPALP